MEKNYYRDEFEDLLKEQADGFRMYPSKKVWSSIYNNLYPGRRWPSLTVMLLLMFSMAYIGITHSNQVSSDHNATQQEESLNKKITTATGVNNHSAQINPHHPNFTTQSKIADQAPHKTIISTSPVEQSESIVRRGTSASAFALKGKTDIIIRPSEPVFVASELKTLTDDNPVSNSHINISGINNTTLNSTITEDISQVTKLESDIEEGIQVAAGDATLPVVAMEVSLIRTHLISPSVRISTQQFSRLNEEAKPDQQTIEWMENYAFQNKPSINKWKNRTDFQAWVTPSAGYRSLKNYEPFNHASRSSLVTATNGNEPESKIVQYPAINLEAGIAARIHSASNVYVKVGVQFNYTGFGIQAQKLHHSTYTTLLLNDPNSSTTYLMPASSEYSNINGVSKKMINNNSFQVSVPVGVDFHLAGAGNVQWFAGADVQPGYVFGGRSLLISADQKNYIENADFRRKWNLSSAVSSYLTYKTPGGVTFMAGPQFRYQLLSTYNSQYTYKENLYNFGIKLGVIKKF